MSIVEGVVRRRARDRALVVLDAYGMRGRGERDEMADAIVDAVLRMWPSEWMTCLAKSRSFAAGEQMFHACELVRARCLEYLEWRYGTSPNVGLAITLLLRRAVDEVAMFWLEGPQHRTVVRQAIAAARRSDA